MTRAACAICALWLVGCAHAPTRPVAPEPQADSELSPEQVVRVQFEPPAAVAAGARGELRIQIRIAAGYHVMSDQPSNPLYIATRVQFEPASDLSWEPTAYPPATSFQLAAETIATFERELVVRIPFTVAPGAAAGPRELRGALQYQSCTRTSCLFPVKRPLSARLEIAAE